MKTPSNWKNLEIVTCRLCGWRGWGRLPRGRFHAGDGTLYYPRAHKVDGKPCEGRYHEAILQGDS